MKNKSIIYPKRNLSLLFNYMTKRTECIAMKTLPFTMATAINKEFKY